MACLILISKPEIDTKQREYYKLTYLMNTDAKIFNKILANLIEQYIKKNIQHDQGGFIPGVQHRYNICKSLYDTPHKQNEK